MLWTCQNERLLSNLQFYFEGSEIGGLTRDVVLFVLIHEHVMCSGFTFSAMQKIRVCFAAFILTC